MKTALFDCETWDLAPTFAPIICVSILDYATDEIVTLRQDEYVRRKKADDMVDDHMICVDARDLLEEYHLLVAWHGKGFDVPLLNSRLALHGERCIDRRLFVDPMYAFRGWRGLKPMSSSLKNVAKFFKLDEQKYEVQPEEWLRARLGNEEACDIATERCESDCRVMKSIYDEAMDRALIRNVSGYP